MARESDAREELTLAERDDFEERAAIMEYDAGLSRAEAERLARACVETSRNWPGAAWDEPSILALEAYSPAARPAYRLGAARDRAWRLPLVAVEATIDTP